MGSLSSEDLSDSGPTRISFFVPEMYSSLEESIDTAITVSGKSFQIPGLLTSSRNQSESVSPSGNMNNSQRKCAMLQELHSKLLAARNFELVAKFWGWYILLRTSGVNGRLSCYWDHDQDCLGYAAPERLWEMADNIDKLEEQMQERGCPLTAIPLELWREDTRSDTELQRLAKVLSQHSE